MKHHVKVVISLADLLAMFWGRSEMNGVLRQSMEHLAWAWQSWQATLDDGPTQNVLIVPHLCFDVVEGSGTDSEVQLPDVRLQHNKSTLSTCCGTT